MNSPNRYIQKQSVGGHIMNGILKSLLKALLAAVIAAAVLVFIFGFIALRLDNPIKVVGSLGLAALILSSFIGGVVAAKEDKAFAAAAAFMAVYIFINICVSVALGGTDNIKTALFGYLGSAGAAMLGAFVGRRRKPKHSKSLKKFKKYQKA